jgi:arsenate reductase
MPTRDVATTGTVLFVCLHGSAKSLIAAEYFRKLAAARGLALDSASAGLEPDAEIPPKVVSGLLRDGIDVRGQRPRPVDREELAAVSRVISFGCELTGFGGGIERWDDIPAVSEDFDVARDAIVARVEALLTRCERAVGAA